MSIDEESRKQLDKAFTEGGRTEVEKILQNLDNFSQGPATQGAKRAVRQYLSEIDDAATKRRLIRVVIIVTLLLSAAGGAIYYFFW